MEPGRGAEELLERRRALAREKDDEDPVDELPVREAPPRDGARRLGRPSERNEAGKERVVEAREARQDTCPSESPRARRTGNNFFLEDAPTKFIHA